MSKENIVLKRALERTLKNDPTCEVCAILTRDRKTGKMELLDERFKLSDSEEKMMELNETKIIMEFYIVRKVKDKEYPVASRSCPWYGCMTCEAGDCDEECPPGTCT